MALLNQRKGDFMMRLYRIITGTTLFMLVLSFQIGFAESPDPVGNLHCKNETKYAKGGIYINASIFGNLVLTDEGFVFSHVNGYYELFSDREQTKIIYMVAGNAQDLRSDPNYKSESERYRDCIKFELPLGPNETVDFKLETLFDESEDVFANMYIRDYFGEHFLGASVDLKCVLLME